MHVQEYMMRFIRAASIFCISAVIIFTPNGYAQEIDLDELLVELNGTDDHESGVLEDAQAAPAASPDPAVPEAVTPENQPPPEVAPIQEDQPVLSLPAIAEPSSSTPDTDVEVAPAEISEPLRHVADNADPQALLLAQQEEVRRQAKEVEALKNLAAGQDAIVSGDLENAVKLLEMASRDIPTRPATDDLREEARASLGHAFYLLAREKMDTDLGFARKNIDAALDVTPENRKAQSLEKRILAREKRLAEQVARPKAVTEQPKYAEKYTRIDQLLREGRDLVDAREYNDAELAFEQVLQLDEYNLEAMRFLKRIEEKKFELRTREREATVAGMIEMVRDTWNPPIRTDAGAPQSVQAQTQVDSLTAQQKLQKKLESIIIPSIDVRQANVNDVFDLLVSSSVAGDSEGLGVNIILKLGSDPSPSAAPSAPPAGFDDNWGFGGGFGEEAPAGGGANFGAPSSVPLITVNLRRVSLLDAIKYITEMADLRYRLEENAVFVTPANVVSGRVITRMYPVQPSILDVIVERGGGDVDRSGEFIGMGQSVEVKRQDVKDFFERAGVPFPVGTSITYNQSISQLIVANTAENLENFERILARLNVIPNQVEIEARFVEVNQSKLDEIGFQWFLTDNWEIAQKKGGAFPAATESIIMQGDSQGITKGNRFFGFDSANAAITPVSPVTRGSSQSSIGNIATFASLLTNPELAVVITALSQDGNSDLLSAPRITTRSGQPAQISVVKEIIYPTEFESEVQQIQGGSGDSGTPASQFVTVTPGSFETRETGVILNVTPTVGPDGYTIDLVLNPEVAELIDWIQYGSVYFDQIANIPQPVFASRNASTSIVVWDGQTVVMGGLIREELVKFEDKVPVLGDIPLLGRLFRSNGEYSQKKNLLIFVTARLVGPDGRPINRDNSMPGADSVDGETPL